MSDQRAPGVSYDRQRLICDPARAAATHVSVVGLGTAGSHAAAELCRLGIGALTLYDPDRVEPANLPSQRYGVGDLGEPKAAALGALIERMSDGTRVEAFARRLEGGEALPAGPVVLAVDDMDARRDLVSLSLAWRAHHPLVIDCRMGAETLQVLAFDPSDAGRLRAYEALWYPQSEALPLRCGGQTVSYMGAITGALCARHLCRHLRSEPVPFLTTLDAAGLTLQTVEAGASR